MSVVKDKVQVSIEFLTDETKRFAQTIEDVKGFQQQLRKAQKEGGDINGILQEIIKSGKTLSGIDLKNVMPTQLTQRAEQLKNALKFIPEQHPARVQMEAELKAINDRLADMNAKTKGAAAGLKSMGAESGGMGRVLSEAFSIFLGGGVLGVIQTVVGAVFSLGKTAVKSSAEMESLEVTLGVLLGSGEKATDFLKRIQKLATDTPFEFPQLAEAGKKLVAFGYSGEQAIALLKRLGDVAAASQVPIEELAGIVGKAKLGQLVQGEELNQLADRGINVFGELAQVLGTTEKNIKKLGSEGKISYADLEKAIELATNKGGQFYGLMEKQSKTLNGLMSTLSDNFGQFVQALFGGIGAGIKPIVSGISDFFAQITDLLREGKQPVGEYAGVIAFLAKLLQTLGGLFGIVWELLKVGIGLFLENIKVIAVFFDYLTSVVTIFESMVKWASELPIIGQAFKFISDAIGVFKDLLSNAAATFAGFRAAAQQAITNVQNYFRALIIDAQILGAKIASALSFDQAIKDNATKYIEQLEAQKTAMWQTGQTVEQAYQNGRQAAIKAQHIIETEAEKKRLLEKNKKAETDEKKASEMEKKRQQRLKDALELELKDKEILYRREALLNEIEYSKKAKDESEYNRKQLEIERDKYDALIKIYETYQASFGAKTEQFRDLELKKLEAEKKRVEIQSQLTPRNVSVIQTIETRQSTQPLQSKTENIGNIQAEADIEKSLVHQKFKDLLSLEKQFEIKRQEIQSAAFQRQLDFLIQSGNKETDEYERIAKAKLDLDRDIAENRNILAEQYSQREKMRLDTMKQTIDIAVELLNAEWTKEKQVYKERSDAVEEKMSKFKTDKQKESAEYKALQKEKEQIDKDELAARKKAGAAIKAFQIAQIVTDGIAEVQGIWKAANLNALNILFPGAGELIAAAKTSLAVGRTAVAIGRVNAQQFAAGGIAQLKSGIFGGNAHSAGGTKGFFEDGTAVEVERDEAFVVVNKKNTGLLKALSYVNSWGGNGRHFFAEGGIMNLSPNGFNAAFQTPSVAFSVNLDALAAEIQLLRHDISRVETTRKAYIVIDELEAKLLQINRDREDATF